MFCILLHLVFVSLHAAKLSSWYLSNYAMLELAGLTVVSVDLNLVTWFVYYLNVPRFQEVCIHYMLSKHEYSAVLKPISFCVDN